MLQKLNVIISGLIGAESIGGSVQFGDGGQSGSPILTKRPPIVLHDAQMVVAQRRFSGLLLEVALPARLNVLPVDDDVVVAVHAGLLVVHAQGVHELVLDGALVHAVVVQGEGLIGRGRQVLSHATEVRPTASGPGDLDVVAGLGRRGQFGEADAAGSRRQVGQGVFDGANVRCG